MYNECCKYKKAKKITIKNEKRIYAHKVTNDCDYESEERMSYKPQPRKKSKSILSPMPKKYFTDTEKILLRIQPPMADRKKYINPRHVLCFLEEPEHPCPVTPKRKPCPAKPKSRKRVRAETTKQVASDEKNEANGLKDEERVEGNQENKKGHPNEGKVKKEQKDEKKNSSARKNKRKKDKFWCPEENKTKSTKPKELELDESSDCKDTICSFDSEVYLAGCGLTKQEKEKIEKNRQPNSSRQFNKRKKNIHEDANTKERFNENKKSNDSAENPTEVDLTNDKHSKE